jgi:hypothetical protein
MGKIGIKRKAGSRRNKRGQSSPKAQFYGNGNTISVSNKMISDENLLVEPPITDAIVGATTEAIVSTRA